MTDGNILLVMRGYPGTGKTTLARILARTLGAVHIDRDVIRGAAVEVMGETSVVGRLSYQIMFALCREQLKLGLSVIIDSPLTYHRTYEQAQQIAANACVPILVVRCKCPPEIQRRRLENRTGQVSPFQITEWKEWLRWMPRFEAFEDGGFTVDTSERPEVAAAEVISAMRNGCTSFGMGSAED